MHYRRILVPIDGSATAERGLREAVALAADLQASVHLLHAVDTALLYVEMAPSAAVQQAIDAITERGAALLAHARERVASAGVAAETELIDAGGRRVADAIVDAAARAGADLVVMGTHGRRGLNRLALGSDAELVVRLSPVPVLLVRHPESAG
jgi:nucleotide-binding universal stress UspA family protein